MCVLEKGVADLQENVAVYLKHLEVRVTLTIAAVILQNTVQIDNQFSFT